MELQQSPKPNSKFKLFYTVRTIANTLQMQSDSSFQRCLADVSEQKG